MKSADTASIDDSYAQYTSDESNQPFITLQYDDERQLKDENASSFQPTSLRVMNHNLSANG